MDLPQIQSFFNAVDTDHSGKIDGPELQAALQKGGFVFNLQTVAHFIRLHDRDGDARLDFDEFVTLHRFLTQAQDTFVELAGRAPGAQLSAPQLQTALAQLGFAWLETPVFNSVSAAFNPTRSSMFTLPDLVAMLAFLKSSKAMFASYDPAGRGVISLSLNQFCYAASNTM